MKVLLSKMLANGQMVEIKINIDRAGKITALVEGMTGPGCSDVSAFLDSLGIVIDDQPTDDYFNYSQEVGHEFG